MVTWKVTKLIVKPDADGLKDVVAYVQWKVVHGETVKFGTVGLRDPGVAFVPYADLTEDTVLSWVWAAVDKSAVEAEIAHNENIIVQSVEQKPLPWSK